jgi:hypothetical protein
MYSADENEIFKDWRAPGWIGHSCKGSGMGTCSGHECPQLSENPQLLRILQIKNAGLPRSLDALTERNNVLNMKPTTT